MMALCGDSACPSLLHTHHETCHSSPVHTSPVSSPKQPLVLPPPHCLAILIFPGVLQDLGVFCRPHCLGCSFPLTTPFPSVPVWITQPPRSSPGLTFSQEQSYNYGLPSTLSPWHLISGTAHGSSLLHTAASSLGPSPPCPQSAFLKVSTPASLLSLPVTA